MVCSYCKGDQGHNITTCPVRIQDELDKINELIEHLKASLTIAEAQREATMKEAESVTVRGRRIHVGRRTTSTSPDLQGVD